MYVYTHGHIITLNVVELVESCAAAIDEQQAHKSNAVTHKIQAHISCMYACMHTHTHTHAHARSHTQAITQGHTRIHGTHSYMPENTYINHRAI